jgi:threonine aldolase
MIDFRSDTVTKPTKEMRDSMYHAIVGDDVYEDDPTVTKLELLAKDLLGKEHALFVPSGTMGNQIAIMAHTKRGDEIILGSNCHIKNYEVGAAAVLSGVSFHLIPEHRGMMDLDQIKKGIRGNDIHFPKTSLICLENAHGTGVVLPIDYMKSVYQIAQSNHVKVHLDGARIFNAATALGVDVKEIAANADSIMFCLSKGLASPVGSLLVGDFAFIQQSRKYRKMLGGGMRQVGVLAAPGLISLHEMTKRLHIDHENAKYLAEQLSNFSRFEVDWNHLDINMVFVKMNLDQKDFSQYMKDHGILVGGYKDLYMRLVCHHDISKSNIDDFIEKIKTFFSLKSYPIE